MKKKILTIIMTAIVILFIALCGNCFAVATDIMNTNLENSINRYFTSEYNVKDTVSGDEISYFLDLNNQNYAMEMELDVYNSRLLLKGEEVTFTINYDLHTRAINGYDEDNDVDDQVKFIISANKNLDELDDEYKSILEQIKMRCYLCSSFAIGQDFSVAFTAYKQYKEDYGELMWDYRNENDELVVWINLEELATIKINESESYYISTDSDFINDFTFMSIHNMSCWIDPNNYYETSNGVDIYYTGEKIQPEVSIYYYDEDDKRVVLDDGADYSLKYINNKNPGTATIEITGKGHFTGKKTETFKIVKRNITDINFVINVKGNNYKNYTGKEIKPAVEVYYMNNSDKKVVLKQGTDYTISSYNNNINPGMATITVKGIGIYTGIAKVNFYINPPKVTGGKASTQTTSSITLTWKKVTGVTRYAILCYNEKFKEWEWIKDLSSKKNTCTISKLKKGTTYKFKIVAYKSASEYYVESKWSATIYASTKTSAPKISKVTAGKKKATVQWKKVTGATGYEVYMSTKKGSGYKKIKTVTNSKTVKYTKAKLTKKKTYYFKVRTYRTINGKKVYSSYSSVKSVKVK